MQTHQANLAHDTKASSKTAFSSVRNGTLQRKVPNSENEWQKDSMVPPIVHEVLRSPGQPLDTKTRAFMEPRFGHDFSQVRVHTDARAAESAQAVNALAYTVGHNMVFDAARYEPRTISGKQLLAHELTHVAQQSFGTRVPTTGGVFSEPSSSSVEGYEQQAEDVAHRVSMSESAGGALLPVQFNTLQKAETLGTRVKQPPGAKRPHKKISATFDGNEFVMQGDGAEIIRASGQSGRPNSVRPADAKACGGSPDDSYLNNPRYVGITDNGPIPEGEFIFQRTDMQTFSFGEQAKMALAGESEYVDPAGLALHGDWGAARAPLRPLRILPSKFCGSTGSRSGFYLHGGVMPGSSGCIDVGNDAITKVVEALLGYPDPVHVTVKYTHPPPDVGFFKRAEGRFMYPQGKNPSFRDRLKSIFGGGDQ